MRFGLVDVLVLADNLYYYSHYCVHIPDDNLYLSVANTDFVPKEYLAGSSVETC